MLWIINKILSEHIGQPVRNAVTGNGSGLPDF